MSNGKSEVIEEIRSMASDPETKIPQKTYTRLMLAALVDVYDTIKPIVAWKPAVEDALKSISERHCAEDEKVKVAAKKKDDDGKETRDFRRALVILLLGQIFTLAFAILKP